MFKCSSGPNLWFEDPRALLGIQFFSSQVLVPTKISIKPVPAFIAGSPDPKPATKRISLHMVSSSCTAGAPLPSGEVSRRSRDGEGFQQTQQQPLKKEQNELPNISYCHPVKYGCYWWFGGFLFRERVGIFSGGIDPYSDDCAI
jgi:hypothetical protein